MSFTPTWNDEISAAVDLVAVDRPVGLSALRKLAEERNDTAVWLLGLYLSEETPTMNEAVKWLTQAAAFGSADAAWNLAMVARENGDAATMRRWIDTAADLGEEDAIRAKAHGYEVHLWPHSPKKFPSSQTSARRARRSGTQQFRP